MKRKLTFIATLGGAALLGSTIASAQEDFDAAIESNARTLIEEGRQIFRYDTFGSEVFWGDTLQLHRAIAGEANGGVGPGFRRRPHSRWASRLMPTRCPMT